MKTKQTKDELWHYLKRCERCGYEWAGIHCKHDGVQTPCPKCGAIPKTEKGECNCEFDI
jgi:predicted nucleic acid-binding Zn ribbon protein